MGWVFNFVQGIWTEKDALVKLVVISPLAQL